MEIPKQHPDFFNSAPETVENDFFDKIDNLVFFLMKLHEKHGASSVNFDLITKMIESLVIVQDNLKNKISDINQLGTISDIEEILLKGKDLIDDAFLKSTFQDLKHFEVENQVVQKKKEELRNQGIKTRNYRYFNSSVLTLNGLIRYKRMALVGSKSEDKQKLSKIGYKSYIFPLDAALKISELPFNTTIGAMLAIVYESITSESYEEAKKNLKRTLHIEVNDDKMRFITNHIGKIIHTLDTNNANKIWNNYIDKGIIMKQNRPGILYLMLDGAMLPTRSIKNEACTDENSDEKLTPNENLPNPEDDSFEEKRAVYVENKLGVAIKNEWIHFWKHKKSGERRHRILNREYVALLGNCHNFTKYFMALAISNGYGVYENTVIISDGATWIKNMVYEHFKNTTYILDFYHLKEHVSNFAKEIFNNDQEKLSNWTDHISKLLLKSKKDVVIKEILNFGEDKLKKCKSNLVKYIENHKDCIDYATYKEKGYFIGSGAIESGHRTVLQRRMKQPGMRWNPDTAQYMLTLMAKYKSKLWGEGIVKPVCQHFGVTPQDRFPWVLSDDRHFNF